MIGLFALLHGRDLIYSGRHFITAVAITLAFAIVGRLAHGVSTSGAIAGAVVAFLMATRDLRMFWILLVVFAVTLAATRLGGSRKKQLRVAESDNGRSASQVMANLGIAGLIMAIPAFGLWRILALAALAEAAADTASSEIGTAFRGRTVLITSGRAVTPGIDGGISLNGTVAALLAAGIIAACGMALGLTSSTEAATVACAGTLGMLVDSLLGATLERRGYLNNDLVNLFGTSSAVLIAWLLMR
ncbi:MAG TPA: DUF92 domain-containing protein [Candidatus Solibacter sp.]|nr:DUF92 domain-containing protein [Candidatus Solibacter sp.]